MCNTPRHVMEAEAAFKVEQFMRREFGLSPAGATAEVQGSVLRVTLAGAVSPVGRVIAQAQGGEAALANVYDILHAVNRDRMHALVGRILGVPVCRSMIEADLPTWDVFVTFHLACPLPAEFQRPSGVHADVAHSCLK